MANGPTETQVKTWVKEALAEKNAPKQRPWWLKWLIGIVLTLVVLTIVAIPVNIYAVHLGGWGLETNDDIALRSANELAAEVNTLEGIFDDSDLKSDYKDILTVEQANQTLAAIAEIDENIEEDTDKEDFDDAHKDYKSDADGLVTALKFNYPAKDNVARNEEARQEALRVLGDGKAEGVLDTLRDLKNQYEKGEKQAKAIKAEADAAAKKAADDKAAAEKAAADKAAADKAAADKAADEQSAAESASESNSGAESSETGEQGNANGGMVGAI